MLFRAGVRGFRAPSVGVGVGGGFGGYSSMGVTLGFGFPAGGSDDYPPQIVVDMTPL